MRNRSIAGVWALLCLFVFAAPPITAQPVNELPPFSSVNGELAAGESQEWTFTAVDGEVISLVAEGAGGLDPSLTLISETGAVLFRNDDFDYPQSTTAVLQGITMPFTGSYTVRVSAFTGTAGTYTLARYRGFAGLSVADGLLGGTWEANNDALNVTQSGEQVTLSLTEGDISALAVNGGSARLSDFYAQVSVNVETGTPGWAVHMTARQQSANSYYQLSVNHLGFWRWQRVAGSEIMLLQDWISSPVIEAGTTTFDLGVMANGAGLGVFYNGSPLSHFVDANLPDGIISLGIDSVPALESEVTVNFSDLIVTAPLTPTTGQAPSVEQIILEDPLEMALSLEHRMAIPAGGQLAFNVPQSSVQSASAGISRIALASDSAFSNLIISTDITLSDPTANLSGCGIYLRAGEGEQYLLAYLDQTGAYGLSERQGEQFLPGVFGQLDPTGSSTYQLIVIATGTQVSLYVNGQFVGRVETTLQEGGVGNAAVNFEPGATTCSFANTWLWEW